MSPAQRRCATYPRQVPLTLHHHQCRSTLPLFPPQNTPFLSLLFPNQAMEEELTPSHQIHPSLARDQRRTREGRRQRAHPPPRPPLPRRRQRRRTSPSFFSIFPEPSRMNLTRSTPIPLYSNMGPLTRALLVAGELPLPIIFLPLPSIKHPSPFMVLHH